MPDQWNGDFNLTPVDKPWKGKFDLLPAPKDEGPEDPTATDKFIGPVDDRSFTTKVMDQVHATARNHPYITGILQELIGGPEATPAGQKIMQEKGITGIEGPRLTPMPGVKQVADAVANAYHPGLNTSETTAKVGGAIAGGLSGVVNLLEGGGDPRATFLKAVPEIPGPVSTVNGKLKIDAPTDKNLVSQLTKLKPAEPIDINPLMDLADKTEFNTTTTPVERLKDLPTNMERFGATPRTDLGYPYNIVPNRLRPTQEFFSRNVPAAMQERTAESGITLNPETETVNVTTRTPRITPSEKVVARDYEAAKNSLNPTETAPAGVPSGDTAADKMQAILDRAKGFKNTSKSQTVTLENPSADQIQQLTDDGYKLTGRNSKTSTFTKIVEAVKNTAVNEKGAIGDQSGPKTLKELQESQSKPSTKIEDLSTEFLQKRYEDLSKLSAEFKFNNNQAAHFKTEDALAMIESELASRGHDIPPRGYYDPNGVVKPLRPPSQSRVQKLRTDETGALILRGFKKPQVQELRNSIMNDLASSDRIDRAGLYDQKYSNTLTRQQFDKIFDNIADSGDFEKLMQTRAARDQAAANLPAPRDTQEAIERLLGNIQDHIVARKEQDALVSAEKRARIQNAMAVKTPGMEGFYQQLRELQGKYPKVDVPTLEGGLNPQDIQNVRQAILNHPELTDWQKIDAQTAFAKAIGKSYIEGALQPKEIELLQKVFGTKATDELVYLNGALGGPPNPGMATQALKKGMNIAGQAKGLKFGADIGWPLRQGINYALSPTWFKNTFRSIPAFFSENWARRAVSAIKQAPDYEQWIKNGLAITDFTGHTLREESFPVDIAPGLRKYFGVNKLLWTSDASNRAMVVGLDGMRIDKARQFQKSFENMYTSLMKDAMKAPDPAIGAELKNAAERYNTNNPQALKTISEWVNTATGRGELPFWMHGSERMLNHLMSSPRLVSSRLRTFNRILNPLNYASVPKPMRIDALKQLASIATVMGGTIELAKMFRGSEINDNPTSSDFLKPREGRTRLDPSGSMLGYIYPFMRLYYGASTVGDDQQVKRLNTFGQPTGTEVVMNTLAGNRLSPFASLATAVLNHAEFGGKPLNWTSMNPMENTLTRTMGFPVVGNLFIQDLYDMWYENPELAPTERLGKAAAYAGPDWLGMGVNTYQPREKQTPKPKLSLKTTSIGPFHLTVPSE